MTEERKLRLQVLNSLRDVGPVTREQLGEPLRPFADANALAQVIERLVGRGLVEGEGTAAAAYRLTDQGRHVHGAALFLQKQVREQAIQGVSDADYATAIRVLQRLVTNLVGDDVAR